MLPQKKWLRIFWRGNGGDQKEQEYNIYNGTNGNKRHNPSAITKLSKLTLCNTRVSNQKAQMLSPLTL